MKTERRAADKAPARVQPRRWERASLYALTAIIIVVAAGGGLRIFKGIYSGILYDEAYTLFYFTSSYDIPLTHYENPNNNHVINSLLMIFFGSHFDKYECFFRIHTMFFSLVYCVSVAWLCWLLLESRLLRVLFTVLLVFHWFLFDISYPARGYSIALAAFCLGAALLVFFQKRKMSLYRIWMPVAILVCMNILALGSMLSALCIIFSLNICYIAFFCHRPFEPLIGRIKSILIHLAAVSVLSAAGLYALYRHILKDILAARESFGKLTLWQHLVDVLWTNMLKPGSPLAKVGYILVLLMATAALLYGAYMFFRRLRRDRTFILTPRSLIILTTAILCVVLYIYRNVLGLSLGYARNGVFMMPLLILFCAILIDAMLGAISGRLIRGAVLGTACLSIAVMAFGTRPSLYGVQVNGWAIQSVSGPLAHELAAIDPGRTWRLYFPGLGSTVYGPSLYYRGRGYKLDSTMEVKDCDVVICHISDAVDGCTWYKPEFFKRFDCKIVLRPDLVKQYHLDK